MHTEPSTPEPVALPVVVFGRDDKGKPHASRFGATDAALQPLGDLIRRDSKGFALRRDRVSSSDQPNLWFVGHNYDATGGLANIAKDAALSGEMAASFIRAL